MSIGQEEETSFINLINHLNLGQVISYDDRPIGLPILLT